MIREIIHRFSFVVGVGLLYLFSGPVASAQVRSLGPFGGDVRSLAQDPKISERFYLGTSNSQIFISTSGGTQWRRLSAIAARSDFVIDHIVIDPTDSNRIYAGVWSITTNTEGGVFLSQDAGNTWEELLPMHGQSVRALAMAPSNPRVLVAGTLDGVLQTQDGGETWKQISPFHHAEIRNVESVAIDPRNPQILYIGTWHLPWKTTDGGASWTHIHHGIVDDSDVFAIFIHPDNPDKALLSACSGIYETQNGGTLWSKLKGIPSSSRRTRAIAADPDNPKVIYAGTTEGLWRTMDDGLKWSLMTPRTLTVNAIVLDAKQHSRIFLATDDAGILLSTDRGVKFTPENLGFTSRAISSVLVDRRKPKSLMVAVLDDHEHGGVFQSDDAGISWRQVVQGLGATDVHTLFQSQDDNSIWAGTSDGAYIFDETNNRWKRMDLKIGSNGGGIVGNTVDQNKNNPGDRISLKEQTIPSSKGMVTVTGFSGKSSRGHPFYVASWRGLFVTRDSGITWKRLPMPDGNSSGTAVLALSDGRVFFGTSSGLYFSKDEGGHFKVIPLEDGSTPIHGIVAVPGREGIVLTITGKGLYRSVDGGSTWTHAPRGLPRSDISAINFETHQQTKIYVTESYLGAAYQSSDLGETWEWINPLPELKLKYKSILSDPSEPTSYYALFFREGLYAFRLSDLMFPHQSKITEGRPSTVDHE